MNRTLEYSERGNKIIRRDFHINSHDKPEKDVLKFINDLIEKGLISSKVLSELIKDNWKDSVIETKEMIKDSAIETKNIFKESIKEILKGDLK